VGEQTVHQVLFRIPVKIGDWLPNGIPIYGYGTMLFVALVVASWLAGRRAEREGIGKQAIQDLGVWLVVGGIIGARLAFIFVEGGAPLREIFRIWDGGLVFYGCIIGGLAAYLLGYRFIAVKHGVTTAQLADVISPAFALAICLGRIGCLLNGCCYGYVGSGECTDSLLAHFPLSSPPRFILTHEGYQTAAGFTMNTQAPDDRTVDRVEPESAAQEAGLRTGDIITKTDGHPITDLGYLDDYLSGREWPRGKNDLGLTVRRGDKEIALPTFRPKTLGLYPTQVYESIAMGLTFLLLTAYYPFRRRPGEVMAVFMFCYGLQRFFNEMLRDDPRPIGFERYVSILLVTAAVALWLWLRLGIAKKTPEPVLAGTPR
jgi:phosphatidylglycerol:prolipoprotein diacylglycerol transferase